MLQKIAFCSSLVVVLALAGTAFAGNGGGGTKSSSSSISAPLVVSSASVAGPSGTAATGGPSFGEAVTFNVSTTETSNPFVNVNCYQNGVLVEQSWAAFWPSPGMFVLSSPAWTGGAANCTANLGMYVTSSKYKVLASASFSVSG